MALDFSQNNLEKAAEAMAAEKMRRAWIKDARKEKRQRLQVDFDFQKAEFLKATSDAFPRYLESRGIVYRRGGRLACPFHNGDNSTGSHFYFEKNLGFYIAYCFTGGCEPPVTDFISAVRKLEGCDFKQAIKRIADFAGVDCPFWALRC